MSSVAAITSAVSPDKTETLLFFTLLQLTAIILVARLGGEIAKRVAQSVVVGEIIIGILLGPSLFGAVAPDAFHYIFRSVPPEPMLILSQIGLILLMFQIGLEFDFSHLSETGNRVTMLRVAIGGLVAPFVMGLGFGYYTAPTLSPHAHPLASALFIATAFSITALPILGRIMIEFDIHHRPLGVIAIGAAAINDVFGWLLLALVTALAVSNFALDQFSLKVLLVSLFFVLSWRFVRPVMKRIVRWASSDTNKLPNNLLAILLAAIFLSAMTTYRLGIFAIFGGFLMGVLLHDEHALVTAWKERIGHFVSVFFLPIFFTYTGLRTDIGGLNTIDAWLWCALTVALATAGKFGGSYLAARWSGLGHNEANVLGIMMNTRALMELIVINVGYDLGVISPNMFTMLVIMAIVSTVITTPLLRVWLPRTGIYDAPAADLAAEKLTCDQ